MSGGRDSRRPDAAGRPSRGPSSAQRRRPGTNARRGGTRPPRPPQGRPGAGRGGPRPGERPGVRVPLRPTLRRGEPGRRIKAGLVLLVALLLLFTGRLVQIQGIESATYAAEAADLRLQRIEIPTTRGEITDVNGNPFAVSVETRTVFVDPMEVDEDQRDDVVDELAQRFDLDPEEVAVKVDATPTRYQVVARNVTPEEARELGELELAGVNDQIGYRRVYPDDSGVANLVGFVGADGHGLEGLEGSLDDTLAGQPGRQHIELGAGGTQIPMAGGLEREPVPGTDVRLTLDRDIQWQAQEALQDRVEELNAAGGSVIVMRPTGEILAMANAPTFDPNAVEDSEAEDRRNGAVADAFEPGSTNKVITAAAVLEEGLGTPDTVYSVPESLDRHDRTFRDATPHGYERLTMSGIIALSSNVGTVLMAEQVGADGLYDYLGRFGFGKPTGLDLPGENAGIVAPPDEWWGTQLATISFGQGISVNAVQAASVYATIANDGVRAEPHIVAGTVGEDGELDEGSDATQERVISEESAADLRLMLEAVTGEHGTAQQAQIPGYRVAGKTGTAQNVNPETGTYEGGGYTSTFVGFAPADDPELVVQVVLHDAESDYHGGEAAGPVFSDVMSFALKSEQVPPADEEMESLRLFEE
ncbi:penicillin-binding protein 2 [Spiractinospora alimapuensis]|uniref:peptidoglycan D,D-transpeptidase FtsI family protein n=1 Tax=Spiractinospora alimapuensis TaxID=2820884 RepID=UPI001F3137A0|nr:penicillin-binding protein 2 [Spiractinospora alimapuensis]QVQ53138.1 penicillin-binding protein 2 [Spiractinospora alimapuensis]